MPDALLAFYENRCSIWLSLFAPILDIHVKNIPEKMDAIVIFTPGADVNQYVTHSVVVNGKIYQDDGSYAEATNRLLDKQ